MPEKHPRSGISHNRSNFFSLFRPVAVDRAILTGRFIFPEGTFIETGPGIVQKTSAVPADHFSTAVMFPAEHSYHHLDGSLFSCLSFIGRYFKAAHFSLIKLVFTRPSSISCTQVLNPFFFAASIKGAGIKGVINS